MTTALPVNTAAQEQAAMHRTELLLARCRHCPPLCAPTAAGQAGWHERQQAHFLAWLDAGGFAQGRPEHRERAQRQQHARRGADPAPHVPDPATPRAIENSGIAPLFSVP